MVGREGGREVDGGGWRCRWVVMCVWKKGMGLEDGERLLMEGEG